MLRVEQLTAGYNGRYAIENVSFEIEAGSIVGILGENGCGKTTLLRAMTGGLPHQGRCMLRSERLDTMRPAALAKCCAFISQRTGISVEISVLEVVLMAFNTQIGLLEKPGQRMIRKATEALEMVGMADRAQDLFQILSEGQKQLCMLARTLASDATLLLMDEPESAMDIRMRMRMMSLLRQVVSDDRCALLTLHDPQLALNTCDRLLLLHHGCLVDDLRPQTDAAERLSEGLSAVFGTSAITCCYDRRGKKHWVMLKEEEP